MYIYLGTDVVLIRTRFRNIIPIPIRELDVALEDETIKLGVAFVVKRWKATQQNIENNSNGPNINRLSVTFLKQNFRCCTQ